jgi:hypothetical protein
MKKLALATVAAAALTAASTADARPLLGDAFAAAARAAAAAAAAAAGAGISGGCQVDDCPRNGPQLTGLALPTVRSQHPIVNAVTLSSGEAVDLR